MPEGLDDPGLRNGDERAAWPALLTAVRRSWSQHAASRQAPSDEELVGLLRVIWVEQLEVDEGERDESVALGWLGQGILTDPAQDRLAWTTLLEKTLRTGATRSGADARRLRQVLTHAGTRLAVPVDIRTDVERLRIRSQTTLSHLAPHAGLAIGDNQQRLTRVLAGPLAEQAKTGSCLVVGAPGAGKTGALCALADQLRGDGYDLVVLAADMMQVSDLDDLRVKLQLSQPLDEVLADWPGDKPGVLIIDALDAARGPDGPAALTQLVEQVATAEGRWHVVASVRTFDLRHNHQLRGTMPSRSQVQDFRLPEFADIEHFLIGDLTDEELGQLADVAPDVHTVLTDAPRLLRELVANPFNLNLLASLVERQVDPAELRPLRTQLGLLDLYWKTVVLSPAAGSDARQAVLAAVCQQALAQVRLQVERQTVAITVDDDALHRILSSGVLIEVPPGGVLDPERLAFSHHVLFDYAFARLVLAHAPGDLARQLAESPDLVLLARPALVMALSDLWDRSDGRDQFWQTAMALADVQMDDPVRLVAPAVIVDLVEQADDLAALIAKSGSMDADAQRAQELLAEIVRALVAAGPDTRPLANTDVGLWAKIAQQLSRDVQPAVLEALHTLVWALWREAESPTTPGQTTDGVGQEPAGEPEGRTD